MAVSKAFFIQLSIALLTLIVPEIWKDTFEWLRGTQYWRLIQFAVVIWILIVLWLAIPWTDLLHWLLQHRILGTILSMLIGALVVGGCFLWVSTSNFAKTSTTKVVAAPSSRTPPSDPSRTVGKKIPDAVLAARLQEIKQLETFIGGKDEGQLWELFDLQNVARFNIMRAKECLNALSPDEAAQCNAFFKEGKAHLDLTYGASISRSAGGIIYHDNPKRLNILNTSGKFVSSTETLRRFETSTLLPAKIKDAVMELRGAVNDNISILHQVINKEIEKNPDHIIHESDGDSPYFGGCSGAFLDKRVWLEPKQKAIISAIEEYLNSL
jgi:hypothetical protein